MVEGASARMAGFRGWNENEHFCALKSDSPKNVTARAQKPAVPRSSVGSTQGLFISPASLPTSRSVTKMPTQDHNRLCAGDAVQGNELRMQSGIGMRIPLNSKRINLEWMDLPMMAKRDSVGWQGQEE